MKNVLITVFMLLAIKTFSQVGIEWGYNYGGTQGEGAKCVKQTSDKGFVLAGISSSADFDVTAGNNGGAGFWVLKTGRTGNIEWEQAYGGSSTDGAESIDLTDDGGYIVGGYAYSLDGDVSNNYGNADIWVLKLDSLGNIEWGKNYGGSSFDALNSIIQTIDGGYIFAGYTESSDFDVSINKGVYDYWVVKTDSSGDIEWEKTYGGTGIDRAKTITQTSDNGYIISGRSNSGNGDVGNNYGNYDIWILKIDENGNVEWENNYGGTESEYANSLIINDQNGFMVIGRSGSDDVDVSANNGDTDYWLINLDSLGTLLWEKNYGGSGFEEGKDIQKLQGNGYLITGISTSFDVDVSGNFGSSDTWIVKVDDNGNIVWQDNIGGSEQDDANKLLALEDGSYVIAGYSRSSDIDVPNNYGNADVWLLKFRTFSGRIYGSVTLDRNSNCIYDTGDTILNNVTLIANNTNVSRDIFGYTSEDGNFLMEVDTISYVLSWSIPSPYFESVACSADSQLVNLNGTNREDTVNFYLKPVVACPYLEVDIATIDLVRCQSSTYYVRYCNNGTEAEDSAYVEIDFDRHLSVNFSTIPWSQVQGNRYTFPIGKLEMLECGTFKVDITVDCDSTFVGQTLCTRAQIFPDSFCLPNNGWNGAELQATAKCLGSDSVEFNIKNIGNGDVVSPLPMIVIEDVILRRDTLIQLNAGGNFVFRIPVSGLSQRIIARQPQNHPLRTYTTDVVSLCNTSNIVIPGPITDTTTMAYSNDEELPFVSVDCQQAIGAYDPNDKSVYPVGVSSQHFITEDTELKYKIRFQNTGNDTAHNVSIMDSISPLLNITTLQPGVSSHSYQLDIYSTGILNFRFDNIMLPDSFVNEPESHGFVQYKIKQKEGNTAGDIINNNADIFFDYNPAIKTNTVFNKIGGIFLDTILYRAPTDTLGVNNKLPVNISVYPNPATDFIYFDIGNDSKQLILELYTSSGQLIQKKISVNSNRLKVERGQVQCGAYLFKLYIDKEEYATGTLIFQ